jgi:hypothetical protein
MRSGTEDASVFRKDICEEKKTSSISPSEMMNKQLLSCVSSFSKKKYVFCFKRRRNEGQRDIQEQYTQSL